MPARLADKTVVVTGATSGIGLVTARRLYAEEARVLVTGRAEDRGMHLVGVLGDRSRFHRADLTEPGAADAVIGACLDHFGRLDAVVNCAAVDHTAALTEVPLADIRRVLEVNTVATIAMIQRAAEQMRDGGSIVNITSRLAVAGVPTMSVYAAAKGAVEAFTRSAAVELAPRGIRVNNVAPGMTRTPLYEAWLARTSDAGSTEREVVSRIPLRRLAEPDDVAAAVCYLISDDARYVTGTTLRVDGGYTAQ